MGSAAANRGVPQGAATLFRLPTALLALMLIGLVTGETPPWEQHFGKVAPDTSPEEQTQAVEGLLQRLLQERAKDFAVSVDPSLGPEGKDTFMVTSPGVNASVDVAGTSGVAAAWGILHYLKYSCNAHVSWEADQLDLPVTLPPANFKVTSNDRFRYYQNVCTPSYSMVWWGWQRWQREIDWMALNGINLPLAFTGQEAIWHRLYTKMGLTQAELDEHFVGPAFLSWGRMGNIRGWGGPLPLSWHNQTLALQHQILARMRQFGITPILAAFAGHVPAGLARLHPEANITRLEAWGHFGDPYSRTYLLDPTDPLFQTIGSAFIQEMTAEFGTNHMYNCDTFNEMTPSSSDPEYLRSIGASIYEAMKKTDPDAIWVMQGWLFFNGASFWHKVQAQALLTSVPIGRMLVLDLASEIEPQYGRLESYFGQPFIFCMLHNYGGVDGLFGNVQSLLKNMNTARHFPNVTLVGTGLTPEGINQNYVMYDLMSELAWRTQSPNVSQWAVDYARRRYGSADSRLGEAWQLLMGSVYNCTANLRYHGKYVVIMRRPKIHPKIFRSVYNAVTKIFNHGEYAVITRPDINLNPDELWYSVTDMVKAWDLLVASARDGKNENIIEKDIQESEQNSIRHSSAAKDTRMNSSAPHKQHSMSIESQQLDMAQKIQENSIISKAFRYRNKSRLRGKKWKRNHIRRLRRYTVSQYLHINEEPLRYQRLETFNPRKTDEETEAVRESRLADFRIVKLAESQKDAGIGEEVEKTRIEQWAEEKKKNMKRKTEVNQNPELREYIDEFEVGTRNRGHEKAEEAMLTKIAKNLQEQTPREGERRGVNKPVTEQATFHHDLVDVTRQMLQLVGGQMVMTLIQNYNNQVFLALQESDYLLQDLLKDLDLLLGSSSNFLLGRWLEDAATWATDQKERDHYIFNALNQITLWGPTGEIHDYAIKQWAGLVQGYIRPRWELFGQTLLKSLQEGTPFDGNKFRWNLFTLVEDPFTKNTNASYPSVPQGDSVQIACDLYAKYRPVFNSHLLQVFQNQYLATLKKFAKEE